MYEVELKFRVDDPGTLAQQLQQMGARREDSVTQEDLYFRHPDRDFAQTDEALRVRRVGGNGWITYKGPKLDPSTKTRREIEVPIGGGEVSVADLKALLLALGFAEVRTVTKQRECYRLRHDGLNVEVGMDTVEGLGRFVELEATASDADLDETRRALGMLARQLSLGEGERRSYLELLLEQQLP